jgi:phosphopantetheine adenylyltransferase
VERDVVMSQAQALVDRIYVARADDRQKEMGLAYIEAERQDLAREITKFTMTNRRQVLKKIEQALCKDSLCDAEKVASARFLIVEALR